MYVGRIVAIGRNQQDKISALYRVSSRSFPNRQAKINTNSAFISPFSQKDVVKNPFISYTCLSVIGDVVIISNGTHTDILVAKIKSGFSLRDTLISVLHTFDYEQDALCTPRIAAIIHRQQNHGYLGIITKNSLHVQSVSLDSGMLFYLATYQDISPGKQQSESSFSVHSAKEGCQYILSGGIFSQMEHPVCSVAAMENNRKGYDLSVCNF